MPAIPDSLDKTPATLACRSDATHNLMALAVALRLLQAFRSDGAAASFEQVSDFNELSNDIRQPCSFIAGL